MVDGNDKNESGELSAPSTDVVIIEDENHCARIIMPPKNRTKKTHYIYEIRIPDRVSDAGAVGRRFVDRRIRSTRSLERVGNVGQRQGIVVWPLRNGGSARRDACGTRILPSITPRWELTRLVSSRRSDTGLANSLAV